MTIAPASQFIQHKLQLTPPFTIFLLSQLQGVSAKLNIDETEITLHRFVSAMNQHPGSYGAISVYHFPKP